MIYGALDLAKQTGVAWGEPGGRPVFETWPLGGQSLERGRRGANLMRKLVTWLEYVKPDKVFIEGPMNPSAMKNKHSGQDTNLALMGYIFVAETVCFTRGVPTVLLDRQDILSHFTGHSRYKVPGMAKKNCMVRACQLRWQPANEDEADAGAMWHYGCSLEDQAAFLKRAALEPPRTRGGKLL